jgi:hypothetical protein
VHALRISLLALTLSACTVRPSPCEPELLLSVTLSGPNELRLGQTATYSWSLLNEASRTEVLCLTEEEGFTLWGTGALRGRQLTVTHPTCTSFKTLRPGQTHDAEISVTADSQVGLGEARLFVNITVARRGAPCSLVRLSSEKPVTIVGAEEAAE